MKHMSIRTFTLLVLTLVFTVLLLTACGMGGFQERYYVDFDSSGGTPVEQLMVAPGDKLPEPEAPTKEGADFLGWYLDGEKYDFSTPVKENITLTARWRNFYTVEFYGMDGTLLGSEKVYEGEAAAAPEAPDVKGYEFIGWSLPYDNIQGYTKIVAKYVRLFTVTFLDDDGTELKSEIVREGEAATAPAVSNRLSEDFAGWDKAFDSVSSDLTVTAKYDLITFTVTFVDHDGTELKAETVNRGTAATAPADPTRTDHRFLGWDKSFDTITADLTVTAKYELIQHTVTFVGMNGTTLKTEVLTGDGKAATAPADVDVYGYSFKGWDRAFDNVTSDLTVTAQYEMITYTVTFVDHDGTELKAETVQLGKAATAPADPTRTDYRFTGWDRAFDLITGDLTVTAQYVAIIYHNVEFVDYDGTVLWSGRVEEGTAAVAPAVAERRGYVFTGWDRAFDNVTAELTVTAQYVERLGYTMTEIYTEQYAPDASMPITIVSAEELVMLSEYVAANHTLSGYTVLLVCDIDMSGVAFAPIGSYAKPFSGIFDGQGYRVYGLTIVDEADDTGLFGCVYNATVTDLAVEADISGHKYVGGIVGYSRDSLISRLTFNGTVTVTGKTNTADTGSYVGGIVGYTVGGTIEHCTANAAIEATAATTTNGNKTLGNRAGGITGAIMNSVHINHCVFYGSVKANAASDSTGGNNVGGILGSCDNTGNSAKAYISNCTSYGEVTGVEFVGGIIGWMYSNSSGRNIWVYNSAAYGTVTGNEHVGGIAGIQYETSNTRIINCLAAAKIVAPSTAQFAGAVVGEFRTGSNCPNLNSYYISSVNPGMAPCVAVVGSKNVAAKYTCTDVTDIAAALELLNAAAAATTDAPCYAWHIVDGNLTPSYEAVYEIIFVDKEGTVLSTQLVPVGMAAVAPAATVFRGFEFTGWDVTFDAVSGDMTVTAQYTEVNVYVVTFKGQNGEGVLKTEDVNEGLAATAPEAPAVPGYRFDRWSVAFDNITADLEVVAIYVKTWDVTFVYNDGSVYEVITVDDGAAAPTAPVGPVEDGMVFDGWQTMPETITSDITVQPIYSVKPPIPETDYKVLQWTVGNDIRYIVGDKLSKAIADSDADIVIISGMTSGNAKNVKFPEGYTMVTYGGGTGETNYRYDGYGYTFLFKTDKFSVAGDICTYENNRLYAICALPLITPEGRTVTVAATWRGWATWYKFNDSVNQAFFAQLDSFLGEADCGFVAMNAVAADTAKALEFKSTFTSASANAGYSYTCSDGMAAYMSEDNAASERSAYYMIIYSKGYPTVAVSSAVFAPSEDTTVFTNAANKQAHFYCKAYMHTITVGETR